MLIKSRSSFIFSPIFERGFFLRKVFKYRYCTFFFFLFSFISESFSKVSLYILRIEEIPNIRKKQRYSRQISIIQSKEYRRICIFRRNLDFRGNTNGWIDLQEFPEFFYTMGIGMENRENWNEDEIKKKKKEKGRKGIEVSRIINIYI